MNKRNMRLTLALGSLVLLIGAGTANAMDVKDARQYVQSILRKHGPVPVTVTQKREACHPGCIFTEAPNNITYASFTPELGRESTRQRTESHAPIRLACIGGSVPTTFCHSYNVTVTVNKILNFGPIRLTFPDGIKFGSPQFHTLPDRVYMDSAVVQNCSTEPRPGSVSKTLTLSATATSSTTITQSISHTLGFSLRVGYNAQQYGNYSGGVRYQETITQGTAHTKGISESYDDTTQLDVAYPKPKSAVLAEFKVYKLTSRLPFQVKAVIDAPLEANQRGLKNLSDIASLGERTLELRGYVTLAGFSKAIAGIVDAPYDQSQCPNANKHGIAQYSGFNQKMLDAYPDHTWKSVIMNSRDSK